MTRLLAPPTAWLRSALSDATQGQAGLTICISAPSTLRFSGELDVEATHVLRLCAERLGRRAAATVTVDLADLQFVDCAGAGLLMELGHTLGARGTRLVITRPRPQALRMLALAASISPLGFDVAA